MSCAEPGSSWQAVLGRQGFDKTLGGIKENHHMQVISKQERPIAGFYAAGDCATDENLPTTTRGIRAVQ